MVKYGECFCSHCRNYVEHIIDEPDPAFTFKIPLQIIICKKCKKRYIDLKLNTLTKFRFKWFLMTPEKIRNKLLRNNNISPDNFRKLIMNPFKENTIKNLDRIFIFDSEHIEINIKNHNYLILKIKGFSLDEFELYVEKVLDYIWSLIEKSKEET